MTTIEDTKTRIAAVADVLGIGATAAAIVRAADAATAADRDATAAPDRAAAGARALEPLYDQLTRTARRILRNKVHEALAEADAAIMCP